MEHFYFYVFPFVAWAILFSFNSIPKKELNNARCEQWIRRPDTRSFSFEAIDMDRVFFFFISSAIVCVARVSRIHVLSAYSSLTLAQLSHTAHNWKSKFWNANESCVELIRSCAQTHSVYHRFGVSAYVFAIHVALVEKKISQQIHSPWTWTMRLLSKILHLQKTNMYLPHRFGLTVVFWLFAIFISIQLRTKNERKKGIPFNGSKPEHVISIMNKLFGFFRWANPISLVSIFDSNNENSDIISALEHRQVLPPPSLFNRSPAGNVMPVFMIPRSRDRGEPGMWHIRWHIDRNSGKKHVSSIDQMAG